MRKSSTGKRARAFLDFNWNGISNRLAMLLASTLAVVLLIGTPALAQERLWLMAATTRTGAVLAECDSRPDRDEQKPCSRRRPARQTCVLIPQPTGTYKIRGSAAERSQEIANINVGRVEL